MSKKNKENKLIKFYIHLSQDDVRVLYFHSFLEATLHAKKFCVLCEEELGEHFEIVPYLDKKIVCVDCDDNTLFKYEVVSND